MNKVEPTYVTFEQAKWLKEKGFDSITAFMYGNQNVPQLEKYNETRYIIYGDYYLAPEQWRVVEWLRVNHGIWVYVSINGLDKTFNFNIHNYKQKGSLGNIINGGFNSPQEAYSAAFDYIKEKELI
jgi:hypothetical protein